MNSLPIRIAILVRVSSQEQAKGWSLQGQEEQLREYAKHRGYRIVRIFREVGSGRKPNRAKINAICHLAAQHAYDRLLVWRRDRVGRHSARADDLTQFLKECGVTIETMMMGPQSDNATTRFITRQMDNVSQFESETFIERSLAGKETAAKAGRWPLGVPRGWIKPAGWDNRQRAIELHVNEQEAWSIRRAFLAAAEGRTLRDIAQLLGRQSHTTVLSVLHNPIFKGEGDYCGIPVAFPPIVSPELWSRAQSALDAKKRNRLDERGRDSLPGNTPPPWPVHRVLALEAHGDSNHRMSTRNSSLKAVTLHAFSQ